MAAGNRKDSLAAYRAKRDFAKSPEPAGVKRKIRSKGLFFCVQKHLASHLHYDFRLEYNGVLLSWAVPKGPSLNPRDRRLAMHVEDHPVAYGEFEGVIPEGYGAGIVMLWDRGHWKPERGFEDVSAALDKGELKFTLSGVKLKGSWVLVRTRNADDGRSWLLIKHRDKWAGDVDILTFAPLSVKSFGDFDDILAGKEPEVWKSNRPARGGVAGKMLAEVIEKAAARKLSSKQASRRPTARRSAKTRRPTRATPSSRRKS
jgi:bifunctional non-homologous end joining protein LigD